MLPLLVLFVFSKEELYLSITLVTSVSIVITAICLVGLNVSMLLQRNTGLIIPVIRYSFIVSGLGSICSILVLSNLGSFAGFGFANLALLVSGEMIYSLTILLIGRHSLSKGLSSLSVLTNVLAPLTRCIFLITILLPQWTTISVGLYFASQLALALLLSYKLKVFSSTAGKDIPNILSAVRGGVPMWLASLGTTLIDNVTVFAVVALANKSMAADFLFTLRAFAALSIPIQSIASARLTKKTQNREGEIRVSLGLGVLASVVSFVAVSLFEIATKSSAGPMVGIALGLAVFPILRTVSTFLGNHLVVIGRQWARARTVLAGVFTLTAGFSVLGFCANKTNAILGVTLVVVASELVVAIVTLRATYGEKSIHP
jgi:hypothetical protein